MSTAGTGGAPPNTDCSMAGPALPDGECRDKAEGIYALKTVLDVWWHDEKNAASPIVNPGRGTITIYLMGDLGNVCDDGRGVGDMRACGAELPAFAADITCDAYQLEFDDATWDQPDMPHFTTTGSTDGFGVGDVLSIAQVAGLVGIKVDGTFPTSADTGTFACEGGMHTGIDCFPDSDGDQHPGITVHLKTGGQFMPSGCGGGSTPYTYRGSPTSLNPLAAGGSGAGVRALEVHVGLSTTLGGSGTIAAGCESGAGSADAPEDAIKSRVASCKIDPASLGALDPAHPDNACTAAEAQFVDDNVPVYHVLQVGEMPPADGLHWPAGLAGQTLPADASVGPLSSVVRLGDRGMNFTCADVRAAQFPAN
jgi:hypothetical protein